MIVIGISFNLIAVRIEEEWENDTNPSHGGGPISMLKFEDMIQSSPGSSSAGDVQNQGFYVDDKYSLTGAGAYPHNGGRVDGKVEV